MDSKTPSTDPKNTDAPTLEISRELTPASLSRAEAVRMLKPGSHIHISGVCGTGMASVLQLLKQRGFYVTGSDKAFYPPMGEVVRSTADKVYESYSADNLAKRPDMVVIGNSLSRGNPEIEYVLESNLPFASMPEVFNALLIGTREECRTSVVVSGTHGKTTTTSAIATMFDRAGWKPGYFVGGIPNDLPSSIRPPDPSIAPEKRVVVLEGDEYDSAFFSKFSKFHSYRPDILVITSIEFDHADIFESVEQIDAEFFKVATRVPEGGLILVCHEDEHLRELSQSWIGSPEIKAEIQFYGSSPGLSHRIMFRHSVAHDGGTASRPAGQTLRFSIEGQTVELHTSLTGTHNAWNLLAAAAVGARLGLTPAEISSALQKFSGALRRQTVIFDAAGIKIIEDFAHHPTAVKATLEGIREAYPGRRIVAAFEPRSNTSRRSFFQESYAASFGAADSALIVEVEQAGGYSGTAGPVVALDVKRLTREIGATGTDAHCFNGIAALQTYLVENLKAGDIAVLMSNGDFGGLVQTLPVELGKKFASGN